MAVDNELRTTIRKFGGNRSSESAFNIEPNYFLDSVGVHIGLNGAAEKLPAVINNAQLPIGTTSNAFYSGASFEGPNGIITLFDIDVGTGLTAGRTYQLVNGVLTLVRSGQATGLPWVSVSSNRQIFRTNTKECVKFDGYFFSKWGIDGPPTTELANPMLAPVVTVAAGGSLVLGDYHLGITLVRYAGLAPPVAPTVTQTSPGGTIPNATVMDISVSYVNGNNETLSSAVTTITAAAAATFFTVVSPAASGTPPEAATGYNVYAVVGLGGIRVLQNTNGPLALGTNYTILSTTLNNAGALPTGNSTQTETLESPLTTTTVSTTGQQSLSVAAPSARTGSVGYNVYAGTAAGARLKVNATVTAFGTNVTITSLPVGTSAPPLDNLTSAPRLNAVRVGTINATNGYRLRYAYVSSMADPITAPAVTALPSGGSLAAGNYEVSYTLVNSFGETMGSPKQVGVLTVLLNGSIQVNSPTALINATGYNVYAALANGTRAKINVDAIVIGTTYTITALASNGDLPLRNSTLGHVSMPSNPSNLSGAFANRRLTLSGLIGSADPQVGHLMFFVTSDTSQTGIYTQLTDKNNNPILLVNPGASAIGNLDINTVATNLFIEAPYYNTPPRPGAYATVFQGRFLITGIPVDPQTVDFSMLEKSFLGVAEESFPAFNRIKIPAKNDTCTGIGVTPSGAVIFTQFKMWAIRGRLADRISQSFQALDYLEELPFAIGTKSGYTVTETPRGLFFLSTDLKAYLFNGQSEPTEIGAPIRQRAEDTTVAALDRINSSSLNVSRAAYFSYGRWALWALTVPLDSNTVPNWTFFFNLTAQAWMNEDTVVWALVPTIDVQRAFYAGAPNGVAVQMFSDSQAFVLDTSSWDVDYLVNIGADANRTSQFKVVIGNDTDGRYTDFHSLKVASTLNTFTLTVSELDGGETSVLSLFEVSANDKRYSAPVMMYGKRFSLLFQYAAGNARQRVDEFDTMRSLKTRTL